jgi:hypothetical protein
MTEQEKIAQQIEESIQDSLLTATGKYGAPLATGKLYSSIQVKPNDNYGYDIYMEEYGLAIENGRRQAFAPVQPILNWIREKKIKPRNNITVEQLAFVIARSMGLPGGATQPRPFISNGINAVSDTMLDETFDLITQPIDNAFK